VALYITSPALDKKTKLLVMNWSEFKIKYKQEIRVGIVVFIAAMLMRLVRFLLTKN
jgi:hypothetical protein